MGSDLYMEERSFRPREPKAVWEGNELVIYVDVFYHGWQERWRGVPDEEGNAAKFIKAFTGLDIPAKPVMRLVPITDLHVTCMLKVRYLRSHGTAISDCCGRDADSGVDMGDGKVLWRCSKHEGIRRIDPDTGNTELGNVVKKVVSPE